MAIKYDPNENLGILELKLNEAYAKKAILDKKYSIIQPILHNLDIIAEKRKAEIGSEETESEQLELLEGKMEALLNNYLAGNTDETKFKRILRGCLSDTAEIWEKVHNDGNIGSPCYYSDLQPVLNNTKILIEKMWSKGK